MQLKIYLKIIKIISDVSNKLDLKEVFNKTIC